MYLVKRGSPPKQAHIDITDGLHEEEHERMCHPNRFRKVNASLRYNDVTARGNCVNKLGQIVTERGSTVMGMMVFGRRDSGQFPFMDELTAQYPIYYGVTLEMPQWEQSECPLCRMDEAFLSWRDMPLLRRNE